MNDTNNVFATVGCSTLAYLGYPLEVALHGIADAGFKFVEIGCIPGFCDHLFGPVSAPKDITHALDMVSRAGLKVCSLSGHVNLVPPPEGGHLLSVSPEEAVRLLRARIDAASNLEAKVINTAACNPNSIQEEQLFYTQLEQVAQYASEKKITLALEVASGLTESGKRMLGLKEKVRDLPVCINYDTGNIRFYSGLDPLQEFSIIKDYVGHIHLKDQVGGIGNYHFPALGDGEVNFPGFLKMVKEIEFEGPITVEIEFDGPTSRPSLDKIDRAVRTSFAFLQRTIASL